jgi:hypothetical protein
VKVRTPIKDPAKGFHISGMIRNGVYLPSASRDKSLNHGLGTPKSNSISNIRQSGSKRASRKPPIHPDSIQKPGRSKSSNATVKKEYTSVTQKNSL